MPETETQDYLREFITVLFIQKKVIVFVALCVITVTLIVAFLWPPVYVSEAKVLVKHKKIIKEPQMLERVRWSPSRLTPSDVNSEMELVTSINVIEDTVKKLQGDVFPKKLSYSEFRRLVNELKSNLKAEVTPRSDVFKVKLYWRGRVEGEKILKTLLKIYLEFRSRVYSPKEAERFFKTQLERFNKNISDLEKRLIELRDKADAAVPDKEIANNLIIQKNLEIQLHKLMNTYVQKKRFIEFLKKEIKSNKINCFSFMPITTNIGDFGKKLQNLLIEREKLRKIYTDQSREVRAINREIRQASRALKSEVKRYIEGQEAKLEAMKNTIQSIQERLKKITEENKKLYKASVVSKDTERQLRLAEDAHATLLKRWQELKMEKTAGTSRLFTVGIISKASSSPSPYFPKKKIVIPVGLFLAILLGITAGFIVEFFDHRIKRPEDVLRYTGLRTIFSIPRL